MKAVLVLPPAGQLQRDVRRWRESLRLNLPDHQLQFVSADEWVSRHSNEHGISVTQFPPHTDPLTDVIKIVGVGVPWCSEAEQWFESLPERVHRHTFDISQPYLRARLNRGNKDFETVYPPFDAHVYNRLSPKGTDFFYYFPFGYLFRCLGLGPIDEFGFRLSQPIDTHEKRDSNHKVIVVFGGSAAWSLDCLHTEMFPYRLEAKLNEWSQEAGRDLRFTVLNLGQHGNVLLNEILSFTLFCHRLKPDVVIAHDGWNDMAYGMLADPKLLAGYDICYQCNLEEWSQILHDTRERPTTQANRSTFEILNSPQSIVKAYGARKRQFQEIVEAAGGKFVWGLQPFYGSKASLSREEEAYVEGLNRQAHSFRMAYDNIRTVYDPLSEALSREPGIELVDCHRLFGTYDGSHYLFADVIHPTPEGDEVIAGLYRDYAAARIDGGAWFANGTG